MLDLCGRDRARLSPPAPRVAIKLLRRRLSSRALFPACVGTVPGVSTQSTVRRRWLRLQRASAGTGSLEPRVRRRTSRMGSMPHAHAMHTQTVGHCEPRRHTTRTSLYGTRAQLGTRCAPHCTLALSTLMRHGMSHGPGKGYYGLARAYASSPIMHERRCRGVRWWPCPLSSVHIVKPLL